MMYLVVITGPIVLAVAGAVLLRRRRALRIPFADLTREEQTALLENARGQTARTGQVEGLKSLGAQNHLRNNSPWG